MVNIMAILRVTFSKLLSSVMLRLSLGLGLGLR